MQPSILLYGANGYTGKLIIQQAIQQQIPIVLAGRNAASIQALAQQYQLPWRIASLDDAPQIDAILKNITIVLHAAGPFSITAKPMIEACLRNNIHYLDITGEIPVFEMAKKYDAAAKEANIMLMPGVGFDVVPTDCIARLLHQQMPDATQLQLAFATIGGSLSHGTATTMASSLGEGGAERVNGKIISSPLGKHAQWINFGEKKLFVMSIPWGDISTAYHTTGIPNIITYTGISPKIYRLLKAQLLFNWLLKTNGVRNFIKKQIDKKPAGPSDAARAKSKTLVYGKVTNATGNIQVAALTTPDGYTLTAISSLIIAKKILEQNFKPGYQTPAGCYGANLIMEVPGVSRQTI